VKASVLLFSLLAPATALAAGPNFQYEYLELGHLRAQPDGGPTGSGPYADFSYSIMDAIQFRAGYASLSYPLGVSYKDYSLGVTGEAAVNDSTDVYTDILYVNDRYDHLGHSVSDDGYRLAIGLRHRPWGWEWMELDGYLAHNYLGTGYSPGAGSQAVYLPQSSNEAGVGTMFNATHWLSLGVWVARDSTHNMSTSLKLRLYF
jgi:hypothetical protein